MILRRDRYQFNLQAFSASILILMLLGHFIDRIIFIRSAIKTPALIQEITGNNSYTCGRPLVCTEFVAKTTFQAKDGKNYYANIKVGSKRGLNQPLNLAKYQVGQHVSIRYNPSNPSRYYRDQWAEIWFPITVIIWFLVINIVISLIFNLTKYLRNRNLKTNKIIISFFIFFALSVHSSFILAVEKIEYPLNSKVDKVYKVALVLINASNKKTVEQNKIEHVFYTPRQIGDAYFNAENSVNDFIQTISYGKVGFEGTVLGWIDLPIIKDEGKNIILEKNKYFGEVQKHSDLTKYDIVVMHFLTEGRGVNIGWGMGNSFPTSSGQKSAGIVWMINSSFYLTDGYKGVTSETDILPSTVWAHETLHTLGIHGHALSLDCDEKILSKNCKIVPYGNVFSIMGDRLFGSHLDTAMLEDLGWLHKESIQQVTSSGKYILAPLEKKSSYKMSLVIPLKKTFEIINQQGLNVKFSKLRIEYRKPIEYDQNLSLLDGGSKLNHFYLDKKKINKNGVVIMLEYLEEGHNSTVLLDMNPDTKFHPKHAVHMPGNAGKFADSILPVGESRIIPEIGIKISVLRETPEGNIEIQIDGI